MVCVHRECKNASTLPLSPPFLFSEELSHGPILPNTHLQIFWYGSTLTKKYLKTCFHQRKILRGWVIVYSLYFYSMVFGNRFKFGCSIFILVFDFSKYLITFENMYRYWFYRIDIFCINLGIDHTRKNIPPRRENNLNETPQ